MKRDKIKEREIWNEMFRNPMEYVHSIRYILIAVGCIIAVVVIQVACTGG